MSSMPWRGLRHRFCSFRALIWWGALALITWVALVTFEQPEENGTAQEQEEALVKDLVSAGIQSNIRKTFRFRVIDLRPTGTRRGHCWCWRHQTGGL